jgi:spoIIIJ-associated protein
VKPAPVRQKVDRRDRRRERGEKSDKVDKAESNDKPDTTKPDAPGKPAQSTSAAKSSGKSASKSASASSGRPVKKASSRPTQQSPEPAAADSDGSHDNKEHTVDARQVGEEAQRFMSGLVEAFGLTGTVELVEDGDDLEVRVHGQELGLLVGPRGTTLQAVQDVVRVASQRRLGDHDTRLRVDVGGYRERRRVALGQFATKMADEVKASGVARVLEPMSSADRKVVHDTLADIEGITTRSEGEDPQRRVIIAPANA